MLPLPKLLQTQRSIHRLVRYSWPTGPPVNGLLDSEGPRQWVTVFDLKIEWGEGVVGIGSGQTRQFQGTSTGNGLECRNSHQQTSQPSLATCDGVRVCDSSLAACRLPLNLSFLPWTSNQVAYICGESGSVWSNTRLGNPPSGPRQMATWSVPGVLPDVQLAS